MVVSLGNYHPCKCFILLKELFFILYKLSLSFSPTNKLKNNEIAYLVKRIKLLDSVSMSTWVHIVHMVVQDIKLHVRYEHDHWVFKKNQGYPFLSYKGRYAYTHVCVLETTYP